ncbi:hypothetical protein B0T18DRAFT_436635 [Schizothecium vesticola]|uniref:Tyrosinase copper-binding domain-containing protein n=1 Tax=Schizothecium vesticola TaxID=314040 RepID=A0AA40K7K0_9PEZI|nr:hypothetical protein B0T18DRAFT_436635 [Schizothecium vesticola]
MIRLLVVVWALFACLANAVAIPDMVDELVATSLLKLKEYLVKNPQGNCTLETAVRRREWGDLSKQERKAYTDAVLCLQSKPPLTSALAPGAKSRFDDYTVVHIQQTEINHDSYWNWGRYAADPANSPLFNGDDFSLSGDGLPVAHAGINVPGTPEAFRVIPPGNGGGCITSGPFKNMTVNLGPRMQMAVSDVPPNPRQDGLGYNPRCLRRDINKNAAEWTTTKHIYDLITQNDNMYWFQTVLEGQFEQGKYGVHAGGHFTISGDPGGDFYTSPSDPAFYLHHTQVDRVWWIWQMQDLEKRLLELAKTRTMRNNPPSANGTLDDWSNLGVLAGDVQVRDLMSAMGGLDGKLCYIYE